MIIEPQLPKRVKVCCFCEKWESGGIESFLHNILGHMDLSDLEVDIVAARLEESVFTKSLKARGVGFYELSGKLRSPANGRIFEALLKKRNYDVVYLNIFQGMSFYYGHLAERAGISMRIAHSHGAGLRNSPGKILKICLHWLGKELWSSSINVFWACSCNAAKFLFPRGQEYRWIPNGIEIGRFRYQPIFRDTERCALGLNGKTFLVGTVGRLSEEKNHSFLLRVFYEIKKVQRDCALLIVGTGPLEEQLRLQARKLDVEKDVIFYGASSQVERLLWAMDVFVFPSYMEGLGIAAVEAQAAGLPVLASENVPEEASISHLFQTMSLNLGAKKWAQALLARRDRAAKREDGASLVQEAGFDVQAVAERIRKIWMR